MLGRRRVLWWCGVLSRLHVAAARLRTAAANLCGTTPATILGRGCDSTAAAGLPTAAATSWVPLPLRGDRRGDGENAGEQYCGDHLTGHDAEPPAHCIQLPSQRGNTDFRSIPRLVEFILSPRTATPEHTVLGRRH
jgi:hypothetical protein